jgi:outer membrane biosynthesis protein TonB
MRRDARFWRNVVLISLVHVAALIALLRWAGASKVESAQEITWLNTTDKDTSASVDSPKPEETPTPEKPAPSEENQPVAAPATSEFQLPTATPHPTPSATATPKPPSKASPKRSPKEKVSPKPTATTEKKRSKPQEKAAKEKENTKKSAAKNDKSEKKEATAKNGGAAGSKAQANSTFTSTNAGWYGNMLHDRFYREWAQPTTVVASGAKLSALARIRIEKDGRISDFKIVRPSGNVLVDESVTAVGKKVTQVDALPSGVGNGEHYDVNINFALNSK